MRLTTPPHTRHNIIYHSKKKGENNILGYVLIIDLFLPHTIYNCESLARVLIKQLENLLPKITHQIQGGREETVTENSTRQSPLLGLLSVRSNMVLGLPKRAVVIVVLYYTLHKEQCVTLNTFKHLQHQVLLF